MLCQCWQLPIISSVGQACFGLPMDSRGTGSLLANIRAVGCHMGLNKRCYG